MSKRKIKPRFYGIVTIALFSCGMLGYLCSQGTVNSINTPPLQQTAASQQTAAPQQYTDTWNLTLVNAAHPLPDGFTVETTALPNGERFDSRAIDSLQQMLADGRAQGLSFVVCSAYRTIDKQRQLFEAQVQKQIATGLSASAAQEKAKTVVTEPGTSEHNLGLAADIVSLSYQLLDEKQADTPEQKWLMANCHKYGFILRYPKDKQAKTGIIYEPWHYRYVGKEAAAEITSRGLCLEEYLGV